MKSRWLIVTVAGLLGCVNNTTRPPLQAHELAYGASANDTLCTYEGPMLGPASTNTMTGCISYDQSQMDHIEKTEGIEAVIAIWAHELGHVAQFKRDGAISELPNDRKPMEQEADESAGCTLARLNMSPYPVLDWLKKQNFSTQIYGTFSEREAAILRGMDRCMDGQEVFDKVSTHLKSMKERSRGSDSCLYNGPNNNHCAIGILLTDFPINECENGQGILDLINDRTDLKLKFQGVNRGLLFALQHAHDSAAQWSMNGFIGFDYLDHVAEKFGLNF